MQLVHLNVSAAVPADEVDMQVGFARHVLREIADLRPRDPARWKVRSVGVGAKISPVAGVELQVVTEVAKDARRTLDATPTFAQTTTEVVRSLDRLGAAPVLVFDDTDKLADAWRADVDRVRHVLFETGVRWLAEHVGVAALVAVHDAYLEAGVPQHLAQVVALPQLTAEQLRDVILHRSSAVGDDQQRQTAAAVLTDDVTAALHDSYRAADGNLRKAIKILRYAVDSSLDAREPISAQLVRAQAD